MVNCKIDEGFGLIQQGRTRWRTEEEVRHAWMKGLECATGLLLEAERENRDSSWNSVVLEFKAPGSFRGSARSAKFLEATEGRLGKYLPRLAQEQGMKEEDGIGIALDGEHLAFAQIREGRLVVFPLMKVSRISFQMVVEALEAHRWRAVTAENLVADFGHGSATGRNVMEALLRSLKEGLGKDHGRVGLLFGEWASLYGQASDLGVVQRRKLKRSSSGGFLDFEGISLAERLFAAHTFHALLMKLVAAEVLAAHGLSSSPSLVQELLAEDGDEALWEKLGDSLERGGVFRALGLEGLVEEVLFSWYLDPRGDGKVPRDLVQAVRSLLAQLALYRFDALKTTGRSRDVLRDFYQSLVPEELRKSLGEFYTPDWLVQHAVDVLRVSGEGWLEARVLDPTCGSGSFLLEVLHRKRQAAEDAGWEASRTLRMMTETVWGFDLNPLAVLSSRVNVLIAVADLWRSCKGQRVELPVLLADAVYSPSSSLGDSFQVIRYRLGSSEVDLQVDLPLEFAEDRSLMDQVFRCLEEETRRGTEPWGALRALQRKGVFSEEQVRLWGDSLRELYRRVLLLHQEGRDGIWFRMVRDFVGSAALGSFDVVLGNPPWVRWSNLPESYRERAKPTCERYGIFSDTKYHGGNELDISALITYTAADKWLRTGGELAFVITQTVFQSPSSQGFRRFCLPGGRWLYPRRVDDLKDLKPFPDATNKTAVVWFEKMDRWRDPYPVDYRVWQCQPSQEGSRNSRALSPGLSLREVLDEVEILPMEAQPVVPSKVLPGAPWSVMPRGRFKDCSPLFGPSLWVQGRKGITTDLNGVFFVEILDVHPEEGRAKIRTQPLEGRIALGESREFWIETSCLYPLAKGAGDLSPCHFRSQDRVAVLVPNRGITREAWQEAASSFHQNANPRTYAYLEAHRGLLERRSTYRTRMKAQGAPFFAIYNVGAYTFAPYKVLWAEMGGDFCSAVAGSVSLRGLDPRVVVPDHKLYFAAFQEPDPAYFLCGLFHAPTIKDMVESHVVSTSVGNILKYLNLPRWDVGNPDHGVLAQIVRRAHEEVSEEERVKVVAAVREQAERIVRGRESRRGE